MFNISCSNVKCSNVKKVRIVEAGVNLIAGSCLLAISGSKEEINPVGGCLALKGAIIGVQELAPIPDWHNQLISIFGNQLDDLGLGSALLSFNRQVEGAFIISLSLAQLIGHTTAYCRDSHFVLSNNTAQEILGSAMIFLVVATATGFRLTNILDDEVDPLPDLAAMTLRTAIFAIPKIIADLVEHMCTTPPADPPAGSEGTHSLERDSKSSVHISKENLSKLILELRGLPSDKKTEIEGIEDIIEQLQPTGHDNLEKLEKLGKAFAALFDGVQDQSQIKITGKDVYYVNREGEETSDIDLSGIADELRLVAFALSCTEKVVVTLSKRGSPCQTLVSANQQEITIKQNDDSYRI